MYKQKLLACLAAILAFSAVGCSTEETSEDEDGIFGTTSAAAVAGWQEGGLLNHPRHSFTLTVLADGKALATGGRGSDMVAYVGYLRSSELYNPSTGAWTQTGQLTTGRMEHAAVRLPNNEVLVVGGYNDTYLATAERFSPTSGTWSPAGSLQASDGLPRGRSWSTATLLTTSGQVVVAGGVGLNNAPQKQVDLYNTTTGIWTAGPNLLVARWGHGAVPLPSGLLVIGGFQYGETNAATNSTELYAGANGGTSTAKGNLLTARGGHTATLLPNGRILVTGGRNGNSILTSAELYDPTSGTWQTTGAMTTARYKHTATVVNGKVLVAGGVGPNDTPLTSTEIYDPTTGLWTSSGALPWSRGLHTAAVLDSVAKLLVAGGWGPQQYSPGNGYMRFTALYDTGNVVVCNQPPNLDCYEATGSYVNGACAYAYKPAGTPCNDSRSCTTTDVCNGAGTCGGTSTCSTAASYYCANSTDRWQSQGTGVCSTTSTCGSTNSFVQSCATGSSSTCLSSTTVRTTTNSGCSNGACASSVNDSSCPTGTTDYCSGNDHRQITYNGCIGNSCSSSNTFIETCRTGVESYCSGSIAVTTSYGGCSGSSCSSSTSTEACWTGVERFCSGSTAVTRTHGCGSGSCTFSDSNQNCPTGTSATCISSTTLQTTTRSGCSGGTCASSTSDTTCATGTTYSCGFTAGSTLPNGGTATYTSKTTTNNGCIGNACAATTTNTICRHEEYCTAGGTGCINLTLSSNADFLTVSFRDVFAREADTGGHAWWLCDMNPNCSHHYDCNNNDDMSCPDETRAYVIMEFLKSSESVNGRHSELANFDALSGTDTYKRSFITALYKDVLQRTQIQQSELNYYVDWLRQRAIDWPLETPHQRYKRLVYEFLLSQEYRDRWTR